MNFYISNTQKNELDVHNFIYWNSLKKFDRDEFLLTLSRRKWIEIVKVFLFGFFFFIFRETICCFVVEKLTLS
jgi:hypothetical protein